MTRRIILYMDIPVRYGLSTLIEAIQWIQALAKDWSWYAMPTRSRGDDHSSSLSELDGLELEPGRGDVVGARPSRRLRMTSLISSS